MGSAYKKNTKNIYGRPDITGKDVIEFGAGGLSSTVGTTNLLSAFGANNFASLRDGRLDYTTFQLAASGLGGGSIGIQVLVNSTVISSGNLIPGGSKNIDFVFEKENNAEIPFKKGDLVSAEYAIPSALGASHVLTARLGLTYLE